MRPSAETVVGAAVVRHGLLLAARRTRPAAAAGRWELPGGKVEPGETPEEALVREVAEELGCTIAVRRWLAEAAPIDDHLQLRVAVCDLLDGEPVATEHDRLAWIGPEDLDRVDWLDPDRPFLSPIGEALLDGEPLAGGNVGGAVRIGSTVRRAVGPWTPAVHALLGHVASRGLRHVPRVHGTDARGREVLDFLPGEIVDVDADELTDVRLVALARWTAELHQAMAGWAHPGPWRFFAVDAPTVVAHNDLAPYNLAWDGDELAGVFDWDLAGPSTPLLELAHLAWNSVSLYRAVPGDPGHAAARLHLLAAAYGGPSAREILDAVPPRVRLAVDGIRNEAALADLEARMPAIRDALASLP